MANTYFKQVLLQAHYIILLNSLLIMTTLAPDRLLQNTTLIQHYFDLTPLQKQRFDKLGSLYARWNQHVNLISRKDIKHLYLRHLLHSLSIAKLVTFQPGASILDVGTGGGLPGIPLAILFPKTQFMLIDSIAKKIRIVQSVVEDLALENVSFASVRAETWKGTYDFIVSRAVASLANLYTWTQHNVKPDSLHNLANGWLCLKGGDLTFELSQIQVPYCTYKLSSFFEEPFFTTKSIVHLCL